MFFFIIVLKIKIELSRAVDSSVFEWTALRRSFYTPVGAMAMLFEQPFGASEQPLDAVLVYIFVCFLPIILNLS